MIKNKYNFFFFFCRTGWRFRLPRSLSSQNRIRFTLQTPTVLRQTLIMLSVRSESFRFFSNRTELLSFVVSCMSILINAFQIVFFFRISTSERFIKTFQTFLYQQIILQLEEILIQCTIL